MPLPPPPPQTTFTFCVEDNLTGELQLLVYFIPFIVGFLFFVTTHYRVNDITTFMLSFGFIINNMSSTALRAFIRDPRPLGNGVCGYGYGMPAREPQQLFFFIAMDVVFQRTWHNQVGIKRSFALAFAAIGSSIIYVHLEYYTVGQVFAGALIGGIIGGSFVNAVRYLLTPFMPDWVFWWNNKCTSLWYVPQAFALTHAFHWHPDRWCNEKGCDSGQSGKCHVIHTTVPMEDLGGDALIHIFIKLLIYVLIHRHT